jgi:hypothetical protein
LSQARNGDIQGHPVHPGGKRTITLVPGERTPELRQDFLCQILTVSSVILVGVGDFQNDPLMAADQPKEFSMIFSLEHEPGFLAGIRRFAVSRKL